jgi:hypothetical protein
MKCENILGLEIEHLALVFWNRIVEYGKSGDHLLQFSPPPVYQWILSKSEFLEFLIMSTLTPQTSDSLADGQISNVTQMSGMFSEATQFNKEIG